MNLLFRSISFIACLALCVSAWSQELQSVEEFLQSKDRENTALEAAPQAGAGDSDEVTTERLSFDDLPFTEYDLDFREWTDATGKFSVIGKFDGFDDDSVLLIRKDNGKQVAVKIELLAQLDAELLGKIKQNMDAILKIREQRELLELFADTRKLIELLEELRSQIEGVVQQNGNKEPQLVRTKRKELIQDFLENLLAITTLSIPTEVLSIGVTEHYFHPLGDSGGKVFSQGNIENQDFKIYSDWRNARKKPLFLLHKQRLNQSTAMFQSIDQRSLVKIGFSSKPRSTSFGIRTLAGLGLESTAAVDFFYSIHHQFEATSSPDFPGDLLDTGNLFTMSGGDIEDSVLAYASFTLHPVNAKSFNEEDFKKLVNSYRSRLLDLQAYDWWGCFGSTTNERKQSIERAKRYSAYQAIAEVIQTLTGEQWEFDADADDKIDRFEFEIKPSSVFQAANKEIIRFDAIFAYCHVLSLELDEETGELTMLISPPVEDGKDFEKRDDEWYLFRYQPTSADGILDINGQFITDIENGELTFEKQAND